MDQQVNGQYVPQRKVGPWVWLLVAIVVAFFCMVLLAWFARGQLNRDASRVPLPNQISAPRRGITETPPAVQQDKDQNQPLSRVSNQAGP